MSEYEKGIEDTFKSVQRIVNNLIDDNQSLSMLKLILTETLNEEKAISHVWDSDGERCLICGDKDWMNTKCEGINIVMP